MTITIATTKVEAYDDISKKVIFSLEAEDDGVHRLIMDEFVSSDGLDALFSTIRSAVEIMDTEKKI